MASSGRATPPSGSPRRVAGLPTPVRQVAAGPCHTGIVTEAGDLLMCGRGEDGKLGLGDEDDRTTPTLVERALFDNDAVLMVACSNGTVQRREPGHTAVLTESGGVYTFGSGFAGQLGHGDTENQLAPRRVPAAGFNYERVVMVAAGDCHTVALSEEGHVFTWGCGECGQLGIDHEDADDGLVPTQVEPSEFGGEQVVFVAAGEGHTVAVTAWGRLYTWGSFGFCFMEHGCVVNSTVPYLVGAREFRGAAVVMAACGESHTLVVTNDGALWACGRGEDGQLGLDDGANRLRFERVGAGAFGGARIVAVAAGGNHSAAVTEDGTLWTWGYGGHGSLGHGDKEYRLVPTAVGGAGLGGGRIGRCRELPAEHALAFAMGTHRRLGAASPVRCLAGEVGLLRMIAGWCRRWMWVSRAAGREEGVVRLLGGGQMLESVRSLSNLPLDTGMERPQRWVGWELKSLQPF